MPRVRGHPKKKPGTNNAKQAAARDAAAALRSERHANLTSPTTAAAMEPQETVEQPRKKQKQRRGALC